MKNQHGHWAYWCRWVERTVSCEDITHMVSVNATNAVLRAAREIRTRDGPKNPDIPLFLHTVLGPDYYKTWECVRAMRQKSCIHRGGKQKTQTQLHRPTVLAACRAQSQQETTNIEMRQKKRRYYHTNVLVGSKTQKAPKWVLQMSATDQSLRSQHCRRRYTLVACFRAC